MSDTIYRQEAIDAIYEHEFSNWCDKDEVSTILYDLPSADRPQGEWIEHERAEEVNGMLISNYECPYCHEWERKASNYCPDCGCRIERSRR